MVGLVEVLFRMELIFASDKCDLDSERSNLGSIFGNTS